MSGHQDLIARVRELELEVERLGRVNEALMNRVERSTDAAGSSYALFESNLLLQNRVNEQIGELVQVNRALGNEITRHRRTEQELRWERNFVDAVLEAAGALILVIDRNGCVVRFNRTCEKVSGYSAQELSATWLPQLIPAQEQPLVGDVLARLLRGERGAEHAENHWISRSGDKRLISWSNTTIEDQEGRVEYVISIGIDVTEVRAAEEKLRLFERIFLASSDGIAIADAQGVILDCNPAYLRTYGVPREQVVGRHAATLIDEDSARRVAAGLSERAGFQGEVKLRDGDGVTRTMSLAISPVVNDAGHVVSWVGIGRDTTPLQRALEELERSNQELRKAQSSLVQSEKMAALGKLVAGIAHEINTPVGSIASMHDTLMRAMARLRAALEADYPADAPNHTRVMRMLQVVADANAVINSGTERVTAIVRRLRSFARLDEAELKIADVHEGLEDTLSLIQHELRRDIEVVRDYGDVPPFSHFVGRLNQVFLNLLVNARQAIAGKGRITIRTRSEGGEAIIEIDDTGCGIPAEYLAKIFDPGFTTKGVGIGTGLGLSICYQIVQEHRGSLGVESTPGCGTTFTLRLPLNLDELLGVS